MKKQQFSLVAVLLAFAFSTLAFPAFAQGQQGGQGQNNKSKAKHAKSEKSQLEGRFADLDRNNNGIITRAEWDGNDRSFANHDTNRDGVLSRDEFSARADDREGRSPDVDRDKGKNSQDKLERKQGKQQGETEPGEMRFRGLDRNRDGIITQAEWRGNNNSFANHDWNGDGVLSGEEVRPGARQPGDLSDNPTSDERRQDRFAGLDSNHNGVISRNEWNGDWQWFERLDTNRNGVLSRDEFARGDDRQDRFAGLDSNHNGVISRSEWTGDSRAFDRLDTNHNGVLSREEFARSDDRQEWRGDAALFERLDTNRDGMLSRAEFYRRP